MRSVNRVSLGVVLSACLTSLPTMAAPSPATVCISSGHATHHTLEGAYAGFGELLTEGGFRVESLARQDYPEVLASCDVLALVNPLTERLRTGMRRDPTNWSAPYESAFSRQEIVGLVAWVEAGGALLLVIDHAPVPAPSRDLLELLGVVPLNGFTWDHEPGEKMFPSTNHLFASARGTLAPHPITRGDRPERTVESVITFGGTAFYPSTAIEPLLVFPPGSIGMVALDQTFVDAPGSAWPRFDIGGWLGAGARRLGEGRAVVLAEAAMCTVMTHRRAGLNPAAPGRRPAEARSRPRHDNRQFCLNVVRWLAGELDPAVPAADEGADVGRDDSAELPSTRTGRDDDGDTGT